MVPFKLALIFLEIFLPTSSHDLQEVCQVRQEEQSACYHSNTGELHSSDSLCCLAEPSVLCCSSSTPFTKKKNHHMNIYAQCIKRYCEDLARIRCGYLRGQLTVEFSPHIIKE